MNHQALARKWRPQQFQNVVGQTHVLKVLANSLTLRRIHHAYLFSGTRGVGKTSIARLFVKGLNCETGITSTPCGICQNCIDIEQGKFIDLIEIDAASRTKVEDTREILDNVQYLPTQGRFKVYLIDEVHMLSKSSFNALLKTLEEPPEYVKFLLATTDPQKIPITILSRCLQLNLQTLNEVQIQKQLAFILNQEEINYDEFALHLLAKSAKGSLRDALSLTDQAIALGNGQIERSLIHEMLGLLSDEFAVQIIEAIQNANGHQLMQLLSDAFSNGVDYQMLLDQCMQLLYQISLYQALANTANSNPFELEQIRRLARQSSPQEVQLLYQILLEGAKSIGQIADKKSLIEMTFLRALAFLPKKTESFLNFEQTKSQERMINAQQSHPAISPQMTSTVSLENPTLLNTLDSSTIELQTFTSNRMTQKPIKPILEKKTDLTSLLIEEKEQLLKKSESPILEPSRFDQNEMQAKNTLSHNAEFNSTQNKLSQSEYQWQFNQSNEVEKKKIVLSFDEKQKRFTQKIIDRVYQKDPWSLEIENLNLSPFLKQIALNAFLIKQKNHYQLHLRSHTAILLEQLNAVKQLEQSLSLQSLPDDQLQISVEIIIDDDLSKQTPFELREAEYLLAQDLAIKEIKEDQKVELICQIFNTSIDEKTIHPV